MDQNQTQRGVVETVADIDHVERNYHDQCRQQPHEDQEEQEEPAQREPKPGESVTCETAEKYGQQRCPEGNDDRVQKGSGAEAGFSKQSHKSIEREPARDEGGRPGLGLSLRFKGGGKNPIERQYGIDSQRNKRK